MADYLPKNIPGQAITLTAAEKVIGGRLVEVNSNGKLKHAAADSKFVLGVAGFDAEPNELVTVYRGGVQRLTASAKITAGQHVVAAADGKANHKDGDMVIGIALTTAEKDNDVFDVAM